MNSAKEETFNSYFNNKKQLAKNESRINSLRIMYDASKVAGEKSGKGKVVKETVE